MLKYEIIINPKLLRKLDQDVWDDDQVAAALKVGDSLYQIRVSYRGNVIRDRKKKSYRIVFQKPFLVNGAHEIHLNAEFTDITLSRNKLSLDFFDSIGVISPHSKHVLLYINGYCKGIYLELESFDQFLLQKRNLPKGPIIYATNNRANFSLLTPKQKLKKRLDEGYTIKYGDKGAIDDLKNFIAMINSLPNEDFEREVQKVLDLEKYFLWLAGIVCTQNYDGFIHNYALYKNGETNLFEITPWDYDGTWGRNLHGKPLKYNYIPITGFNTLTGRLLYYPHFKKKYMEILNNILDNQFSISVQEPKIDEIFQKIVPYLDQDPYIQIDQEILEGEKEFILNFIKKRKSFLNKELSILI